jgi:hypothetical protein
VAVDATRKKACLKKPTEEICITIIITINIHIKDIVTIDIDEKVNAEKKPTPAFTRKSG